MQKKEKSKSKNMRSGVLLVKKDDRDVPAQEMQAPRLAALSPLNASRSEHVYVPNRQRNQADERMSYEQTENQSPATADSPACSFSPSVHCSSPCTHRCKTTSSVHLVPCPYSHSPNGTILAGTRHCHRLSCRRS